MEVASDDELRSLGEPSAAGLARLATALGSGGQRVIAVRQLVGGVQAATHAVHLADPGWIVLKRWSTQDGATAQRAYERLQAVQRAEVPVPVPLAVDPGGSWFGCPALATTYLAGDVVIHANRGSWIEEVGTVLARIHATEVTSTSSVLHEPHAGVSWRPLPADRFPRTPRVRGLLALVESLQHDTRSSAAPAVLLHHDFRQHNLLWDHRTVSGVLDWHDARFGPAVSDLAYLTVDVVRTNGLRAADDLVRAYQQHRGRVEDLGRWQALWLASQLPWMHRWSPIVLPGGRTLTRALAVGRLRALADRILASA